jgi:hypothetical protein
MRPPARARCNCVGVEKPAAAGSHQEDKQHSGDDVAGVGNMRLRLEKLAQVIVVVI